MKTRSSPWTPASGSITPSPSTDPYHHLAIHPYPAHLATRIQLSDGTDIVIRPIRPEDADMEQEFVRKLSPEAKYFRFMNALQELSQEMLVRLTQIDYYNEMALIAVKHDRPGGGADRRRHDTTPTSTRRVVNSPWSWRTPGKATASVINSCRN